MIFETLLPPATKMDTNTVLATVCRERGAKQGSGLRPRSIIESKHIAHNGCRLCVSKNGYMNFD